jgi:hypothetical protein
VKYLTRLGLQHETNAPSTWEDCERVCLVCHRHVPARMGLYHMHLGALTHQSACAQMVRNLERIKDRSAKGRWRPANEVFLLANGSRCTVCAGMRTASPTGDAGDAAGEGKG